MKRRTFLTTAASLTILGTAGCTGGGGGGASVEETADVTMVDTQFEPRNIHVDAGTTVTWTNDDRFAHTVTNASDNWTKNARVDSGGETTHTFDDSGVYHVYCSIHGESDLTGMSMKIGVGDATIDELLGGDGGGGDAYG